ncbi:hypothetical protein BDZ97DRAFT_1649153 [Flammula alnicola]|nr:hypothetical protein BDZ97DRAFT_1649153 [Flammula alnicola]
MLWTNKAFTPKIFNFIFDEGHCISPWGVTFRPNYAEVGIVQLLLPEIPTYVTSATLPECILTDVKEKLHLSKDCLILQHSNDHPNIHFSIQCMQHPQNSYHDLMFINANKLRGPK